MGYLALAVPQASLDTTRVIRASETKAFPISRNLLEVSLGLHCETQKTPTHLRFSLAQRKESSPVARLPQEN